MVVTVVPLFLSMLVRLQLTQSCSIEERGTIFVNPGTEVYEGMIIGENSRENDLTVNITKAKQMTNVRSATKDQHAVIKTLVS